MFVDGYSDTHIIFQWETSSGMDFVPETLQNASSVHSY